jgi:hypothetical protein
MYANNMMTYMKFSQWSLFSKSQFRDDANTAGKPGYRNVNRKIEK